MFNMSIKKYIYIYFKIYKIYIYIKYIYIYNMTCVICIVY